MSYSQLQTHNQWLLGIPYTRRSLHGIRLVGKLKKKKKEKKKKKKVKKKKTERKRNTVRPKY